MEAKAWVAKFLIKHDLHAIKRHIVIQFGSHRSVSHVFIPKKGNSHIKSTVDTDQEYIYTMLCRIWMQIMNIYTLKRRRGLFLFLLHYLLVGTNVKSTRTIKYGLNLTNYLTLWRH